MAEKRKSIQHEYGPRKTVENWLDLTSMAFNPELGCQILLWMN